MKRIFLILTLFSLLLPCLAQEGALDINYEQLNETALRHLVNLINIDTAQPNPKEILAQRYIYKNLIDSKIDWQIYRMEKSRANLISVLKSDSKTPLEPLILISHLDTAAIADNWQTPPTQALIENGKIYGLGSSDAKNYAAVNLTILTWLKKNNIKLNRDIIFVFSADEEASSEKGLKFLFDEYPNELKAGFALNEGGGLIKGEDGKDLFFVESASKIYMDIVISALGEEGHTATVADSENAIYKLSQALQIIENHKQTPVLNPWTKNFFKEIYPLQDDDAKTTIDMLLGEDKKLSNQAAQIIMEDDFLKTQLVNTVTPSLLTSGSETNIVEGKATAVLNCRLLPWTSPDDFFEEINNLFSEEENIILSIAQKPEEPFPQPSLEEDSLFKSIKNSVDKILPGTLTLKAMSPASSESEILRKHGIITYGIGPLINSGEGGPHQSNENIALEDFYQQLKLTLAIVLDFAAQKE
jgi:acetylornithine deacetylase/succinyl-diaminopimelate desuccinylase-like protein